MPTRKTTWIWLMALALATLLVGLLATPHRPQAPESRPNPILPQLQELSDLHGLDLPQRVTPGRPYDLLGAELLAMPPQSLDVLFVGDSSLCWNLSMPVVAATSGLHVWQLAQSHTLATPEMARLVRRLAQRFLKPGGTLVLGFSAANWNTPADAPQQAAGMRALTESDLGASQKPSGPSLFSREATAQYAAARDGALERAFAFLPHHLPDWRPWEDWLEPKVAPGLHAAKRANAADDTRQFFSAGGPSVFLYVPDAARQTSGPAEEPAQFDASQAPYIAGNLQAFTGIWPDAVLYVPFAVDGSRARMLAMARAHVPQWRILDVAAELRPDEALAFDSGVHLANAGGFLVSARVGAWLRRAKSNVRPR